MQVIEMSILDLILSYLFEGEQHQPPFVESFHVQLFFYPPTQLGASIKYNEIGNNIIVFRKWDKTEGTLHSLN